MKLLRLTAIAAAVSLAACTSSPTNSATTDAANPSFDGGNMIGSGNYADEVPGTVGTGNEGQDVASDTTNTPPARGGNTLGSGH